MALRLLPCRGGGRCGLTDPVVSTLKPGRPALPACFAALASAAPAFGGPAFPPSSAVPSCRGSAFAAGRGGFAGRFRSGARRKEVPGDFRTSAPEDLRSGSTPSLLRWGPPSYAFGSRFAPQAMPPLAPPRGGNRTAGVGGHRFGTNRLARLGAPHPQ